MRECSYWDKALGSFLAALVLSMVLSPLLISHNAELAGLVFPRGDTELDELAQDDAATQAVAHREHVIICGYGRVGQNLARVLASSLCKGSARVLRAFNASKSTWLTLCSSANATARESHSSARSD